jgi:hypothetical protein
VEVDPVASMRCWAIDLELGGRTYEIPALPAMDWWPVLVSADKTMVLDFLVSSPEDPFNVDELLLLGEFTSEEIAESLTDAIEQAAGRSFHVSVVLANTADRNWPVIGGELACRGFRWDVQPIGAALDAIYAVTISGMSKESRDSFEALLANESISQPGKGRKVSQEAITEFEAMAGPRPTTGARASAEPSGSGPPKTLPRSRPRRRSAP